MTVVNMKNVDLLAIVELAKLKNDEPEEYVTIRSLIKEVAKDMMRLEVEIIEEMESEIEEKKKKAKDELEMRLAEKMKKDR